MINRLIPKIITPKLCTSLIQRNSQPFILMKLFKKQLKEPTKQYKVNPETYSAPKQ